MFKITKNLLAKITDSLTVAKLQLALSDAAPYCQGCAHTCYGGCDYTCHYESTRSKD